MRRLVLLLLLFVPAAGAWTWPVQGPVLQTFSFDPDHPYAAGQHRGIAIGAGDGAPVLAPTSGVVSFAGTVPTNGKTITIQTPSGLAVSLTHLGSIGVARDASVDEGAPVGTVGSSGTPEFDVPYVHLGVREAENDQGYLDPLAFLPVLVPPTAVPPPAPPVDVPAPAPVLAAPQPVDAPAVPVAPPAPVVEVPAVAVVPAAPAVDVPDTQVVPAPPEVEAAAPAAHVPSLPEVPVAPMSVVRPATAAIGSSPARAGTAVKEAPGARAAKQPALARSAAAAAWLSADSLALPSLSMPAVWPGQGSVFAPRLPAARAVVTPGTVPASHGVARLLPLGVAALLLVAASVALVGLRRRRLPAPAVRLRAVPSVDRGRLAA
jgi:hypothetical protein